MTTAAPERSANRDALTVTGWNLISRITGLARVVAFGGALGATRLGDTYQASNQISNVLFELLAAGTLAAVLVPGLVARLAGSEVEQARALAGVVLGRALLILGPLAVLGVVFAKPIAALLFAANDAPSQPAQVRIGAFLLLFVMPQLVLYAWGAVVTAVLHADGKFAAAAVAPVANNVIVAVGLGLFWYRSEPTLGLREADKWLLGLTALSGVVAMAAIPAVAAWRAGLGVVPRIGRIPSAGFGRAAAWGSLVLLPAQLMALGSLVVAGRIAGGVAAYQFAFVFFLLPHAAVGHPTATVLYPRLADAWVANDRRRFATLGRTGLEVTAGALLAAAALLCGLAPWLVRVVAIGALDEARGADLTALVLAWLALGLPAYGWSLLLSRLSYAADDVRLPARAAVSGAVLGAVALVFALVATEDRDTLRLVALAHTVMVTTTTAMLAWTVVRSGLLTAPWRALGRYAIAAIVAGVAARLVAGMLPDAGGQAGAALIAVIGSLVGGGLYVGGLLALGQRHIPRLAAAE